MRLTSEEYNVLMKISNKAKMDWFDIDTDKNTGEDYIKDYEEQQCLDLKQGILMLDSGLTDLNDYDLTKDEKETYQQLIRKILGGEYGK